MTERYTSAAALFYAGAMFTVAVLQLVYAGINMYEDLPVSITSICTGGSVLALNTVFVFHYTVYKRDLTYTHTKWSMACFGVVSLCALSSIILLSRNMRIGPLWSTNITLAIGYGFLLLFALCNTFMARWDNTIPYMPV